MARSNCGCGGQCSCTITGGRGVQVAGAGTTQNPFVVNAFPMSVVVQDTETVALTLTGTGTGADPLTLSAVIDVSAYSDRWGYWYGTQAEYDALGVYDGGTLYFIHAEA